MSTEMQVVPVRSRATVTSDDVKEALDICEANLKEKATLLVKGFKDEQKRLGEGRPKEEWTNLGCRLVNRKTSVYIEWYVQFWGKANSQGSKVFSRYLKKEKNSHKYNLNVLKKHAADWEHQLIEDYEDMFSQIRKYNANLIKARQHAQGISVAELKIEEFLRKETDADDQE